MKVIPFPVLTDLDRMVAADWCEDLGYHQWAAAMRSPTTAAITESKWRRWSRGGSRGWSRGGSLGWSLGWSRGGSRGWSLGGSRGGSRGGSLGGSRGGSRGGSLGGSRGG